MYVYACARVHVCRHTCTRTRPRGRHLRVVQEEVEQQHGPRLLRALQRRERRLKDEPVDDDVHDRPCGSRGRGHGRSDRGACGPPPASARRLALLQVTQLRPEALVVHLHQAQLALYLLRLLLVRERDGADVLV